MREPLVSVCIPVFNRPAEILRCLKSIQRQTHRNLQILVCDDGSSDETPELVEQIPDSRIELLRNSVNRGNIVCRNEMLDSALGEYIAIMDSDDICLPHRIELQVAALELGFDLSSGWCIQQSGRKSQVWAMPRYTSQLLPICLFGSPLPNPSLMISRSFIEKSSFRFNPDHYPAADYFAIFQALYKSGARANVVQYPVIKRHIHEKSISVENANRQKMAASHVRKEMLKEYVDPNSKIFEVLDNYIWERRFETEQDKHLMADFLERELPSLDPQHFATLEAQQYFSGKLNAAKIANRPPQSSKMVRSANFDKIANKCLISVVIPVFNTQKYLAACVDSCISQEGVDLELILVNDGSTDGSGDMCDKLAAERSTSDVKIKVVHRENGGLSAARNTGVAAATGQFLMFLDSDDLLVDGALRHLLKISLDDLSDVVVGSHFVFEDDDPEQTQIRFQAEKRDCFEGNLFEQYCKRNFGHPSWNKLIRTPVAKDILFLPGIYHEDELYGGLLFTRAKRVSTTPVFTYAYRNRQDSITSNVTAKHVMDLSTIQDKYLSLYRSRKWNFKQKAAFFRLFGDLHRAGRNKQKMLETPLTAEFQNLFDQRSNETEPNGLGLRKYTWLTFVPAFKFRKINHILARIHGWF